MHDVTLHKSGAYWLARWYDSKGVRRGKRLGPIKTVSKIAAQGAARRLAATFIAYPAQGERPRTITLGAWIEEHLHLSRPDWSPRTLARVEASMVDVRTFFTRERPLARISAGEAMDFRAHLLRAGDAGGRGLAPATVASIITHAKALFARGVKTKLLAENPFEDVPSGMPSLDPRWTLPTIDDVRRLLAAASDEDHGRERVLLALCAYAGLRAGEAARFRLEDWHGPRLTVRNAGHKITTKQKTRDVRVEPELREILKAYAASLHRGASHADNPAPAAALQNDNPANGAPFHRGASRAAPASSSRSPSVSPTPPLAPSSLTPHASPLAPSPLYTDDEMSHFRKGVPALFARAGLARWDKCLQTLRRFRENAWLDVYPIPIVSQWMGHSPAVSAQFYRQVPAHHYDLADDGGEDSAATDGHNPAAHPSIEAPAEPR